MGHLQFQWDQVSPGRHARRLARERRRLGGCWADGTCDVTVVGLKSEEQSYSLVI